METSKEYIELVNIYNNASKELNKRRDFRSREYMAAFMFVEGCRNRMVKHPEYRG